MQATTLVFDSWPLVAYFENQAAATAVEGLLIEAAAGRLEVRITSVNLGELWYILARQRSEDEARRDLNKVLGMGLQIANVDWNLALRAARLKAKYAVAYADCFAAALGQQLRTKVVTGDPEFRRFGRDVKLLWVGD